MKGEEVKGEEVKGLPRRSLGEGGVKGEVITLTLAAGEKRRLVP